MDVRMRPSCGTPATCWRHISDARRCDVSGCFGVLLSGFSPDPVQTVPDRREDADDVLAQGIERVEIVEDAGEAVFDLALALGQRIDTRGEGDVAIRLDLA